MPRDLRETLRSMVSALEAGQTPKVGIEDFPCFEPHALVEHAGICSGDLEAILASLSVADVPTLREAIEAIDGEMPAWLGFKIVTDPAVATNSEDTDVVGIKGQGQGSADALPGIFLAYEDARIVFSRPYSPRDSLQMLDITRSAHMHSEQYAGVAWLSCALERPSRVFIFGAGEVPLWVARQAHDVGFETVVLDDDPLYLSEERFPYSKRVLLENFDALSSLDIGERDYVLVLTRGHMHDPECLVFAVLTEAHYVGMMGCAAKNERVFLIAEKAGASRQRLESTHTPIGLRFGAKTPPELGMCIVAEMIQDRYDRRKVN